MARSLTKFITYTATGKMVDEEPWSYRIGTRSEIEASALGLLKELKESNKKARVFIDGESV